MATNEFVVLAILSLDSFSLEELHKVEVNATRIKLANLNMDTSDEDPQEYLVNWVAYMWEKLSNTTLVDESDSFDFVRATLSGGALESWNDLFTAIPAGTPLTLAILRQTLQALVAIYIEEDDRTRQWEFLRNPTQCRKRGASMSITSFKERIERIIKLTNAWMPGHSTC